MQPERSQAIVKLAPPRAPKPGVAETRRIEASDPRADGLRRVVLLARERVVIARSVAGVFMHIAMAPDAYRGVVLRLSALQDGVFHYEIRLVHRDPDLSVTLAQASDDSEIRAEWRLWARFLDLPTLVEREEGRLEADSARMGDVAIAPASSRRRGKAMAMRRPRFLVRRKVGAPRPERASLNEREMFPGSKADR